MSSKLYAYGGRGDSMSVSERLPNHQFGEIKGAEAQKIHDLADFICVSCYSTDNNNVWIIHRKTGDEFRIPLLRTGDYAYLMAECEKIAGRSELTILFC